MRVSPIAPLNIRTLQSSVNFGSIFADCTSDKMEDYALEALFNNDVNTLKESQTRLMRELPVELAISKIVKPDEKTRIKILGSSDGSEAYSYAINLKETGKAKNAKILGVDIKPVMTEIAKTGKVLCSDIERDYANQTLLSGIEYSPLGGTGWDKHLKKTSRPENFEKLKTKYPYIRYMEFDPVAHKGIGRGIEWYEVNKKGLPDIEFKTGDMRDNLEFDENFDTEIYVIANSGGYVMQKDPMGFLDMFETIKRNKDNAEKKTGKNKNAYIVIGGLEAKVLYNQSAARYINMTPFEQQAYRDGLLARGFELLDEKELQSKGVSNPEKAAGKIYRAK